MKIFVLCVCFVIFAMIPSFSFIAFNEIEPEQYQIMEKYPSIRQNQYTLMIFSATWCKPCHWMNAFVFNEPNIKNKMEATFETIFIDVDTPEGYDLKNRMHIKILPTLLIIGPNQRVVERIEDVMDKNEWNNLLEYFSDSHLHPSFQRIRNNSVPKAGEVWNYRAKPVGDSPIQNSEFLLTHTKNHRILRLATYSDRNEAELMTQYVRKETGIPFWITTSYEKGRTRFTLNTGYFDNEEAEAAALALLHSLSVFKADDSENCHHLLR
ncbi:MAG TPA: thioredoxin fold domain-containing protein [Saprospiraceae bacterium]|nr:thioredoxin fold domain-containing protein [Saprospiraceae bacterium]